MFDQTKTITTLGSMVFVGSGALKAPHFHSKFMDFLVFWGSGSAKTEALVPVWRTAFASAESVLQTGTNVSEFGSRGHPDLASKCLLLCLRLAVEGILISRRLMSDTGTLSFHACKRARTSSLRWSSWTLVSLALW